MQLTERGGGGGGGKRRAWPETPDTCKQEGPLQRLMQSHPDRGLVSQAESWSRQGRWGPAPVLAARLREEGWQAPGSGPGDQRGCDLWPLAPRPGRGASILSLSGQGPGAMVGFQAE